MQPFATFLRNLWTLWKTQVPRSPRLWITHTPLLWPPGADASIVPAKTCRLARLNVENPLFAGMIPTGFRFSKAGLEFST
jgi:hypothetical protein